MEKSGGFRHDSGSIGIGLVPPDVEAGLGGCESCLKFLVGQVLEFLQQFAFGGVDALVVMTGSFSELKRWLRQHASMMTLSARVSAACPKVSYASRMWSSLKRWVIGGFGSILCDRGLFSGIGVLTVSTGRVVMLMSRSKDRVRWRLDRRLRPLFQRLLSRAMIYKCLHRAFLLLWNKSETTQASAVRPACPLCSGAGACANPKWREPSAADSETTHDGPGQAPLQDETIRPDQA